MRNRGRNFHRDIFAIGGYGWCHTTLWLVAEVGANEFGQKNGGKNMGKDEDRGGRGIYD